MRLSIGFVFLVVAIAFAQSKPVHNGLADFSSIANQFASQNNVPNQFVPSNVQAILAQIAQFLAPFKPSANGARTASALVSSGEDQSIEALINQLAQEIENDHNNALAAHEQITAAAQQIFDAIHASFGSRRSIASGEDQSIEALINQLAQEIENDHNNALAAHEQITAAAQQIFDAIHASFGSRRSIASGEDQSIEALINQLAQEIENDHNNALAAHEQITAAAQQIFDAIHASFGSRRGVRSAQIQSVVTLANQLAQQVASGQISAVDAQQQITAAVQQVFGSNN
ncbi:unnamed protein product [Adineta ricciae]|uniref:Uncharacterized protein n=1 Tax=Adineta ricciae TaxID=249248 RepID=A0A815RMR8_ADIRI|nr:unnamed protein product [Adineta ricciae]